jgi:hypothetical protein
VSFTNHSDVCLRAMSILRPLLVLSSNLKPCPHYILKSHTPYLWKRRWAMFSIDMSTLMKKLRNNLLCRAKEKNKLCAVVATWQINPHIKPAQACKL